MIDLGINSVARTINIGPPKSIEYRRERSIDVRVIMTLASRCVLVSAAFDHLNWEYAVESFW